VGALGGLLVGLTSVGSGSVIMALLVFFVPLEPRTLTSTYFDTPDRALARAGVTLRRRVENRKGLWQLKLPGKGERLELESPGGPAGPTTEQIVAKVRDNARGGSIVLMHTYPDQTASALPAIIGGYRGRGAAASWSIRRASAGWVRTQVTTSRHSGKSVPWSRAAAWVIALRKSGFTALSHACSPTLA